MSPTLDWLQNEEDFSESRTKHANTLCVQNSHLFMSKKEMHTHTINTVL
jgi:hypothetical protein